MNMDQILAVNYPLPVMPTFESLAQIKSIIIIIYCYFKEIYNVLFILMKFSRI